MNEFIDLKYILSTLGLSILTLLAIFKFYFEKKIINSIASKIQLIEKQRETFSKFLDLWSERITGEFHYSEDWSKRFAIASKDILLWCPDEILHPIALYIQKLKQEGNEEEQIHFAEAILNFRKVIGYKNSGGKITQDQIIKIFGAGYPMKL